MFRLHSRRARVLSTLLALAVVIAIVVVDVVTITGRTHREDVAAAARRAQRRRIAYVTALRGPLTDVFTRAQPLQNIVDDSSNSLGGEYPARDALAHTNVLAMLQADLAAAEAIPVPVDLTAKAKELTIALSAVVGDVSGFSAEASTTGAPLDDDFTTGIFATFGDDEQSLLAAVDGLYIPLRQAEPPVPSSGGGAHPVKLAASHDTYLFAIDKACLAGAISLPADLSKNATNTQLQNYFAALADSENVVVAGIRKAALPAGDAVARRITGQVPVIAQQASLFAASAAAGRAGNVTRANVDEADASALFVQLGALSKLFTSYGAISCGTLFADSDTGSSGSSGSGGSTPA
jgi:hypothetical protein